MTILYHGTDKIFGDFNLDTIGKNGTANGYGIYFTDSIDFAKKYGNVVYTVNLKIKRAIREGARTISRRELSNLLIALHREYDILNDFNDVSYYGSHKVLVDALDTYNDVDCDVAIVSELANIVGCKLGVNRVINDTLGINCIVSKKYLNDLNDLRTDYVAMVPEMVKIMKIENK